MNESARVARHVEMNIWTVEVFSAAIGAWVTMAEWPSHEAAAADLANWL